MLRVKEICKEKGITIAEVANRMGIHAPALSRIINGSNTTTETLERIANALDVSVVDLFERKKEVSLLIKYKGETKELTENDLIEIFKKK
jgi:transcriptional regulator with XRE-family HTH domain